MSLPIFADLKIALAKLHDDAIATTVCENPEWRAESFIDTLRGIRDLKQLVDEAESQCAGVRDLETIQQAAAQKNGGAS